MSERKSEGRKKGGQKGGRGERERESLIVLMICNFAMESHKSLPPLFCSLQHNTGETAPTDFAPQTTAHVSDDTAGRFVFVC